MTSMIRSPAVTMTIFFTVLPVLFTASHGGRTIVGAKTDIEDVRTNKEVQELGRFSVEEYNERVRLWRNDADVGEGEKVEFSKVVEAQKQVVAGMKYYLKIWATQNGSYRVFDSVVMVKPWLQNYKQLLSFAPSDHKIGFLL